MNEATLLAAFTSAFDGMMSGSGGQSEALLGFIDEDAAIVVDDLPYSLDKPGLADHHGFHEDGLWDRRTLALIALDATVYETADGTAGIVTGRYNLRGKPKNAGFRQRPGHLSATCVWDGKTWSALNVHFSPLLSQVLDASPS